MFGIEATSILALGRPPLSLLRPAIKLERKLDTGVMVASEDVQTSFAPIKISTSSGLFGAATAFSACERRLTILAPVTASLPPVVEVLTGWASTTDGLRAF